MGELVAHNHYEHFQAYAHKYNMRINPESAGPHAGSFDGIKNYGFSDLIMSEFWAPSEHRPTPENRFFIKQGSSAAHIYGKKIVGAESFSGIGHHWNDELWLDQKSSFDYQICSGLNRVYFTTFTCSTMTLFTLGKTSKTSPVVPLLAPAMTVTLSPFLMCSLGAKRFLLLFFVMIINYNGSRNPWKPINYFITVLQVLKKQFSLNRRP